MPNRTTFWDRDLRPKLQEIHASMVSLDEVSAIHIRRALFYVEHDIADGRDPRFRLLQIDGVFHDEKYMELFNDHPEVVKQIREAGSLIRDFLKMEE